MSYSIEETNLERQHLLAEFLNPITLKSLQDISLPENARILDIGCGLGDTTVMLSERFPGAAVTGLDNDPALIQAGNNEKSLLNPKIYFVCGDAMHLPFGENVFDFVFTRYCLHHLPSAAQGLKEMKNVCKPGGIVFAHEPDINNIISYPESWAFQKHREYLNRLFADALVGRKLIHYFRDLKLQTITHHTESVIGDETNRVKRFLAMTGAALGKALIQNALATESEHEAFVKELERAQNDSETIVIMAPSIAVWGYKALTEK